MKVALCLYGQPRTYGFCAPSLHEQIISKYNPDIFLCSDDKENELRNTYHPTAMEIHSPQQIITAIGERMNRYGQTVPNPGPYKEYPVHPPRDLCYIYLIWRCREMLRNYEAKHGNYDVVIGTRFDAKFLSIQPIENVKPHTLYFPETDALGGKIENGIHWGMGYAGHLFWGDSPTVCHLLNSYNWSDDYYKATGLWGGEGMSKYFCDAMKINVEFFKVTFMLIRGTNEEPREGMPPWNLLSEKCHPEYMYPRYVPAPKSIEQPTIQPRSTPWGW